MEHVFDRSSRLAELGAPLEAQAMALLVAGQTLSDTRELPLRETLRAVKLASFRDEHAPLLQEALDLLRFDAVLPASIRFEAADPPVAKTDPDVPMEPLTLEGMTPLLTSSLPFREALKIADRPAQWCRATPQMRMVKVEWLPRNGALWRRKLTKETDLAKPLYSRLCTRETIQITANGDHTPDRMRGHRRYTHVLTKVGRESRLMELREDSGWIELRGDEHGIQLRVYKRVTVLRPVDDPYAPILSAGFSALLWLWASGFIHAAGGKNTLQAKEQSTPPPVDYKHVEPSKAGDAPMVAVLGAGPAGLACAWLLSRPLSKDGLPAWTHKDNANFEVKVKLFEKAGRPGGKAASGRRVDDSEKFRIEEHGLHMLMGCYANLLKVLEWVGADGELEDVWTARVPSGRRPGEIWSFAMEPWRRAARPPALAEWMSMRADIFGVEEGWHLGHDRVMRVVQSLHDGTSGPRPLQRGFTAIGRTRFDLGTLETAPPTTTADLVSLATHWLLIRTIAGEALHSDGKRRRGRPGREFKELARLLRSLARPGMAKACKTPEGAMAAEWIELATTIAIGLDVAGLYPDWAVDDPTNLLDAERDGWVRAMRRLDIYRLDEWLRRNGIAEGFVERSRVLSALAAALFTTPSDIAAGTFVVGMARLLLTYEGAPFRRMKGGTGEAVIGPLFQALSVKGIDMQFGHEVTCLNCDRDRVTNANVTEWLRPDPSDFGLWGPAHRPGWRNPPRDTVLDQAKPDTIIADAFVLAIPPFEHVLPGLPDTLSAALGKIESRATVGLQFWTSAPKDAPPAILSGLDGPMRCLAMMDQLDEGFGPQMSPVYACGDVPNDEVESWRDESTLETWLKSHAGALYLGGQLVHGVYSSVNAKGSERYVSSNVKSQQGRRFVHETGLTNLWLAGDWTVQVLSCGSIEAAVTSGLEAAKGVLEALNCEVHFPIVGALGTQPKM
jgi:uncharacterized protein with NAD-binding domain and iron-sulfur cluster